MTISPLSQRALDFGATLTRVGVEPGQAFYRLRSVDGPVIRGGNANIYVDVRDEHDRRLAGIPVLFFWNDGRWVSNTEQKPDESDQGTNMVMSAGGNAYNVEIQGLPSDVVWGMGNVKWEVHHSWQVVYERAIADGQPEPPIEPPVDPAPHLNELRVSLMQIQAIAAAALKRMETM